MSAANDCGVNGGCQACPLFAANVCGDPAPEPDSVFHSMCTVDAHDGCLTPATVTEVGPAWDTVRHAIVEPSRPLSAAVAHRAWERAVTQDITTAILTGDPDGRYAHLRVEPDDLTAVAEAVGVMADDAPDVDPNEPAPAGGCCGGGCCS